MEQYDVVVVGGRGYLVDNLVEANAFFIAVELAHHRRHRIAVGTLDHVLADVEEQDRVGLDLGRFGARAEHGQEAHNADEAEDVDRHESGHHGQKG